MSVVFWACVLLISLVVLAKSADWFTDAASKVGIYLDVPPFIVGVTIVSIGTSLPEIISSVIAVFSNASEFVVGNVIGANIANVFLILGISAIVARNLTLAYELLNVDLPLFVGASFFLAITIWDGVFSRPEAVLFILGYVIYLLYSLSVQRKHHFEITKEMRGVMKRKRLEPETFVVLVLAPLLIYFSATYLVKSVVALSAILNVGEEIIAMTAVSLGTTLPELMVSLQAARHKKPEIAVGNVLGSNVFNIFMVMGVPGLIGNLIIPNSVLILGLPVMLMATIIYFFITQDKQITQWEGWLLLLFYVLFLGKALALI